MKLTDDATVTSRLHVVCLDDMNGVDELRPSRVSPVISQRVYPTTTEVVDADAFSSLYNCQQVSLLQHEQRVAVVSIVAAISVH